MTYMFILKCALKLVEEIILVVDSTGREKVKVKVNQQAQLTGEKCILPK